MRVPRRLAAALVLRASILAREALLRSPDDEHDAELEPFSLEWGVELRKRRASARGASFVPFRGAIVPEARA